jgi:hypothetical protein
MRYEEFVQGLFKQGLNTQKEEKTRDSTRKKKGLNDRIKVKSYPPCPYYIYIYIVLVKTRY